MADKDRYEEYQFSDLDTIGEDNLEEDEATSLSEDLKPKPSSINNLRRNVLVALITIVLLFLGYKFLSIFIHQSGQPVDIATTPPPATMQLQQPAAASVPPSPPIQEEAPQSSVAPAQMTVPNNAEKLSEDNMQIKQKLSDLERSQQTIRTEVSTVGNQLGGVSTNLSNLSDKIANLNQMVESLSSKLEQQANVITVLTERAKPKPKVKHSKVIKTPLGPGYFIQAIIPGRAWLIAKNGSTITVREGSAIPGYGIVQLIDPNQGRVLTSSGQIIKFSQQDS